MIDHKSPPSSMLGPTSRDAVGEDFTDALGRRWTVTGEVVPKEVNVAETAKQRRNPDDYRPGPDPLRLSRDELAEKLRPRRLVGGYEYRLERPDYEIADRILEMKEVPESRAAMGDASGYGKLRFIVGPDDRRRVENPAVFPGSAFAYLAPQNCTATMIGPSTALCAAHCFFQNG